MVEETDDYSVRINRERLEIAREYTGRQDVQLIGRSCASAYRFAHDWVIRISPVDWDSDKLWRAEKLLNRDNWSNLCHLPRLYRLWNTKQYIITIMKYYIPIADWYDDNEVISLDYVPGIDRVTFDERLNAESKRIFGQYVYDAHQYNIGLDRNLVPVVFDFWI